MSLFLITLRLMTQFLKLYEENPNPRTVNQIVDTLKKGGVIIYPTDTVYGLGCDITNTMALEKLARIKQVRLDKANFSFICADLKDVSNYVRQLESHKFRILKGVLPGPYTFILKGNNTLPRVFKKKKTVGVRVSSNNIAKALIQTLGNPIVSTSIHDKDIIKDYTTDPEIIFDDWKNKVDIVIDGGIGGVVPSTVIDLTGFTPKIIRKGKGSTSFIN